jgi:hypothetical protein
VASAGGKISRALREVQPGATLFLSEYSAARQEINSGTSVLLQLGAFTVGASLLAKNFRAMGCHVASAMAGFLRERARSYRKSAKTGTYKKHPMRCNLFWRNGLHPICFVE